jgi:hypothetical protein
MADALVNDAACPTADVSPHNNNTKAANILQRATTAHEDANVWAANWQNAKEDGILFIVTIWWRNGN